MQSLEVRADLVEALRLDIVGPHNNHAFANELLPESPSRWYLTGFLVPFDAPPEQKTDETSNEEIAAGAEPGGLDDDAPTEKPVARKSILPSSMGLAARLPMHSDLPACISARTKMTAKAACTAPGYLIRYSFRVLRPVLLSSWRPRINPVISGSASAVAVGQKESRSRGVR